MSRITNIMLMCLILGMTFVVGIILGARWERYKNIDAEEIFEQYDLDLMQEEIDVLRLQQEQDAKRITNLVTQVYTMGQDIDILKRSL